MQHHRRTAATAVGVIALSMLGVSAAQSAPAQPDLVVTGIDWAPTGLVAGQATTFRATITNRGTAATPAGVIHGVAFSVGGKLVTWSDTKTSSLQPGSSTTVVANGGPTGSATWTATAGGGVVTAQVDDARRIVESNESNNTLTRTATVATGITTRLRVTATGIAAATAVAPGPAPTGLASIVFGSVYIGCVTPDGVQVPGTERFLTDGSVGSTVYPWNGPFTGSGQGEAPAGRKPVQVIGQDLQTGEVLRANQHGTDGLACAAGTTPAFTRFQAKTLTTSRYTKPTNGTPNVLVATVTVPVDLDVRL